MIGADLITRVAAAPRGVLVTVELIRIDKPLAGAVFTLVGAGLSSAGTDALSLSALRAALAMCFIVAFSFAINDVKDADVDRFEKPSRPIPSGRIQPKMAATLSFALGLVGIGLASTLGPLIVLFAAVLIALSLVYSFLLKGTPLFGNALIGLMVGSIPFFGALSIGNVTIAVAVAGGLAFLFAMALEVLFTLLDERGDRQAGLRTTAVQLGQSRTLAVFRGLVTAVAILEVGPWLLGMANSAYILAALACSLLPIAAVVTVLTVRPNDKTFRYCAKAMRVVSYASFLPLALLHQ